MTEKEVRTWLRPKDWIQRFGRYDFRAPAIGEALRELSQEGWEIGLHGSYRSFNDVDRLRHEKEVLEDWLGDSILGGRQHYLNLNIPETWEHHSEIGLQYDTSLGSGESYGFHYGYEPLRPFDTRFVVFPLTVMEQALPDPAAKFDRAWAACEDLLVEAAENQAVMTVLWHPRYFSESDFPGYSELYRRLVRRALELDAWVGPPADCYRYLGLDRDYDQTTEDRLSES